MAAAAEPNARLSHARRLWGYALGRPALLWAMLFLVLARSAAEPALLWVTQHLMNAVQLGQAAVVERAWLVWSLLGLGVVVGLTEFGYMYTFDYVAQVIIRDVRIALYRRIQSLSLGFFEDASTGMLVSRATNDMNVIQARLDYELLRLLKCPVSMAASLLFMLRASLRLTLVALLVVGLLVPLLNAATRLMKRHMAQLQDRLAEMTERLSESIAAVRVVQCFGATQHEIDRFADANHATRRAMMRTIRVRDGLRPVIHFVGLAGVALVIAYGGYLVYLRDAARLGDVVAVIAGLQLITVQLKEYGRARLAAAEVLAAAGKVFALIDTEPDLVDAPDALELESVDGRLEFTDVEFAYRSGGPVLRGVSLTVAAGEVVAFVGSSGAGKTSLVNLVPRLYDVTGGSVSVDGHDVRAVTRDSLRAHLGIVPQQTVLFRGTIAENIAYARPRATREEIETAARAANADGFIRALPDGYDTQAGERGAKLSGGQAQRIAIARAILRDPRILILDEATSSLDTESEALVQEALERLMRGRTSLMIAHRLSTVHNADRIVVLDAGRIVEEGNHRELLARPDGVYRRMYQLQVGEEA